MSLTAQEVTNAINELESRVEELDDWSKDYDKWSGRYWNTVLDWELLYPITINGVEYQPNLITIGQEALNYEAYRAIFQIGNQYFRKNGWYASHDGAYLDGDIDEVKKTTIVIEEWVPA